MKRSELKELFGEEMIEKMDDELRKGLARVREYALAVDVTPLCETDVVGVKRKVEAEFSVFADDSDDSRDAMRAAFVADPVYAEIEVWRSLSDSVVDSHRGSDNLVNHYSLMNEQRKVVPLHFALFRQVAPGITHEANIERVNSTAQSIQDPNHDAETLSESKSLCLHSKE